MKIDSKKDLPNWFCLDSYAAADESFSARDWLFELSLRDKIMENMWILRDHTPTNSDEKSGVDRSQTVATLTDLIFHLRQTPIKLNLPGNHHFGNVLERMDAEFLDFSKPVKPLTFETLVWQRESDRLAVQMGYSPLLDEVGPAVPVVNKCWEALCDPAGSLRHGGLDIPVALTNHSVNRWPHPALLVNLNAPDAILINAFKQWLKESRSNNPFNRPVGRKPLFERWGKYGLLPYLDLKIWEFESNTVIPDRVMSAALSPANHDRGEENIRKTLTPIANKLWRHLHELEMYIAAENTDSEEFEP